MFEGLEKKIIKIICLWNLKKIKEIRVKGKVEWIVILDKVRYRNVLGYTKVVIYCTYLF